MTEESRYPLLRKENVPAYPAVMAVWIVFGLVSAAGLKVMLAPTLAWVSAVGWALVTAMGGMAIMFGASALNLRTLRAGFVRLSRGESDARIPAVWCPVLTMATEAALELQRSLRDQAARHDATSWPGSK